MMNFSLNLSTQIASGGGGSSSNSYNRGGYGGPGALNAQLTKSDSTMGSTAKVDSVKTESPFGMHIPWNLSLGWNYSFDQSRPTAIFKSSSLRASISFELTKNWRIETGGNYDVFTNQFAGVTLDVNRDLHCWMMNFNWYPMGSFRGFKLEIKLKAPELQDIKLTKQGGVNSRNPS